MTLATLDTPSHKSPISSSPEVLSPKTKLPILVPGKFDALHLGHRELARIAAQHGAPILLTFSGMASELSWKPRASVVAPIDRPRVLCSWKQYVGASVTWKVLPFSDIRKLRPVEFVEQMKEMFGCGGFVCGKNWRFGYKAEGDVGILQEICGKLEMMVEVAEPVIVEGVVVSSTKVRDALAKGDVGLVHQLLGRPHRVVGYLVDSGQTMVVCGGFVNQVPGDGAYKVSVRVLGRNQAIRTIVRIERKQETESEEAIALENVVVVIEDGSSVFCDECEVYIDFLERVDE